MFMPPHSWLFQFAFQFTFQFSSFQFWITPPHAELYYTSDAVLLLELQNRSIKFNMIWKLEQQQQQTITTTWAKSKEEEEETNNSE